jgi:phosphohistidine swiveling domain-containing protein
MHLYCPGKEKPDIAAVGGKAANLFVLGSLGLAVPQWFAVKSSAFQSTLAACGLDRKINEIVTRTDDKTLRESLATIRDWIMSVDMSAELRDDIVREYHRLVSAGDYVAVRSSASDEDNPDQSFAGVHDSVLYVKDEQGVLLAIKQVWASAYNERAISYRKQHGINCTDISVAVVVQKMIEADVSGVMFTINPVSGNVHEVVISSLFGVGEGLVSEGLAADTFTVRKDNGLISSEIVYKAERVVLDSERGNGVKKTSVPESKRKSPSLTDVQVVQLVEAGSEIEMSYGVPQDIEFAFDAKGAMYLLQSRQVTTATEYGPAAGNHLIWDNSNIIESYSGVTSPMTFSFIRRAYKIVYNCFCEVMGVSSKNVAANQEVFANMLGLFQGQVYYNLLNWYRLIRLFPGFNYNKQFMESMMGVKEPIELRYENVKPGFFRKHFVELPKLVRLLLRSSLNFIRIRRSVDRFEARFDKYYKAWESMDFSTKQPHELIQVYRDMEDKLLWHWKVPIINDFFVMIFYGSLKKLCESWCGDSEGSLQNDLICGEGGIKSTEPTKMLLQLAKMAQEDDTLRDLILDRPAEELAETIPSDPRFAAFADTLKNYLVLYGFRCMNELKLEEYSLRERPQFLYTMIRNYLKIERPDVLDVDAMQERERAIRKNAEDAVKASLKAKPFSMLRRPIFNRVLRNARLGVKNRENMRFARTRIYGLLRELLRALGDRFAKEGILNDADDIFYLTLDECFDYVKGTAVTTRLAELVEVRRAEFDHYRSDEASELSDRFDTYGMAYHKNACVSATEQAETPTDGVLQGTGCCPGEITGTVKVLKTPGDDMSLSGEILVAERTDPGWVPLYPSAVGILIERGSILSHSAIVAREMGIPTIVGIPGLTSAVQTGQKVTMNGSSGTVKVLDD